ncbi:MAG: hypothetical protein IKS84_02895, partial [Lachnospiraceae bacterium]|nr:hypothetical protein [Lachnospiraceae bacterium]
MGSTGPGHSNGTVYLCDFSGHFSKEVKTAGPLMYSLTIEDMVFDKEPDTEEIIDEVLISCFAKGHSYTCEDMVEINCHGGVYVTKMILNL